MCRIGRWNFVANETGSGGWSSCRDDTDATGAVIVVVVVVVVFVVAAAAFFSLHCWWEVLLEGGSHFAITRLSLTTITLPRPFEEQFYFTTKFLIAALKLHVTTHLFLIEHFHCLDILHFMQITIIHILIIFIIKKRFRFLAQQYLTLAVFCTTTVTSHGTIPIMNFLWIKLSFRTCKFYGYFLTQYETSIRITKVHVKLRKL